MKKVISILVVLISINFASNAQEINGIPPGSARNLPDGWHVFQNQGATFDVEVLGKKLTQGTIVWFDKSKYSGTLSGDNITGKGTYVWKDGQRYEGYFKDDKRHGKGTMYYADGTKHYGKWKNHVKHGKGQTYAKDGSLITDGVWENGKLVKEKTKKKKK
ncbi:MORN repeat-containing protein [Winogradskyella immobilis]|uniref:MORN repeat-containing protein n=1 Tax=Winogradskyella immobilis TaxID=2816852 RepID=A0ABS8EL47_9FLAO|nr:hypothetical protein [Winogradskyella immobilis]MCC1483931.1 hypothetical protein [Winogradskyella immobilis]MCG0016024.1 hypothetical protein [Winogradskyella immobilis]